MSSPPRSSLSAFNQICFCLAGFFNDIIYYCKRAPKCMEEAKLREGKQKGRRTITQASIIMSNRILLRCVFLSFHFQHQQSRFDSVFRIEGKLLEADWQSLENVGSQSENIPGVSVGRCLTAGVKSVLEKKKPV